MTGCDEAPIDRLLKPIHGFAKEQIAGAILLAIAALIAVIWANSPWRDAYAEILHTHLVIGVGDFAIDKSLHHWINDGLMGIFFFVVGLEIKREILAGELSSARKAALPVAAAIGGMLVPAALYAAVSGGGSAARGWGIPMATDIAFALGVVFLLGSRVPLGLRVLLTALAIVDDIGAIVVIAVFYTDSISLWSLLAGGLGVLVSIAANRAGVRNAVAYFVIGTLVWLAFLKSGVHATLAAVLMAMTIPARTCINGEALLARMQELMDGLRAKGLPEGNQLLTTDQHDTLQSMEHVLEHANAPLQKLEHALVPISTFVVMPVFALANAGVSLSGDVLEAFRDPVCYGVILGLVAGKQIGVLSFAWLAVKVGIADLPKGVSWRQVHAVGVLAGIGFTMSLFVATLAFPGEAMVEVAKVGILSASLIAGIGGSLLLWRASHPAR